jgi:hypothetical protein
MLAATATVVVATGQSAASIILLSLTVVAASFVGLAVYRSLAPLVSADAGAPPRMVAGRTRAALEREKLLAMRSIKELEFDYAMKKVTKADYDDMVGRLRARAMGLMRQLEAGDGYRAEIERELAKRVGGAVRETRPETVSSAAPICSACSAVNDADARFCKKCGARLGGAA